MEVYKLPIGKSPEGKIYAPPIFVDWRLWFRKVLDNVKVRPEKMAEYYLFDMLEMLDSHAERMYLAPENHALAEILVNALRVAYLGLSCRFEVECSACPKRVVVKCERFKKWGVGLKKPKYRLDEYLRVFLPVLYDEEAASLLGLSEDCYEQFGSVIDSSIG